MILHFEDLAVGGSWTTRGRTITETDVVNHAALSGDWGPLHVDQPLAGAGHFGSRVAHGSLIIAIAMGLAAMDVPQTAAVGLVGTGWRFNRPVRLGDTIRAHWRIGRLRDVDEPRWGLATWRIEITNQRQEIVAEGEATILVARRDVPQVSITTSLAKRRRRRRGKEPVTAVPVAAGPPSIEANLPEPAPVDVPAPRARRRPAATKEPAVQLPEPQASAAPADAEAPPPPSASARRRRRRRGGGGGSTGNGRGSQDGPPADGSVPIAGASETPYEPGVTPRLGPAGTLAATPIEPGPSTPAGVADKAVGQILKRFRRPGRARPAPPTPGDTRSPDA